MNVQQLPNVMTRAPSLLARSLPLALLVATAHVILISLDDAPPRIVNEFSNITIPPSLTAPGHISIATGSTAAKNDIIANTFHLLASPFTSNVSGFAAPIGGYSIYSPAESFDLTANPIRLALRSEGRTVITATFPGGDGLDVKVPGPANNPIVQPASSRTVDYPVPFGEFGGVGGSGF